MRKIILLDLDDVLSNHSEVWVDYLNSNYHVNKSLEDITGWNMQEQFPTLSREEIYSAAANGEFVDKQIAPEDAVKYTTSWYDEGYNLYVVTSTNPKNIAKKSEWLKKHYVWYNENKLIMCQHKELVYGDFLIDDGIHNIQNVCWNGVNQKCKLILLDKPWNRNDDREFYIRAKTWKEIDDVIRNRK